MRPRARRGFTLLELMMGVAIIGLLASVAVPVFKNFWHRSRRTERTLIVRQIRVAFDDYFNREGRFPSGVPGVSWAHCDWNPTPVAGPRKLPWRVGGPDDWLRVGFTVEGAVYYRYMALALALPGLQRQYQIESLADLDGDGRFDDVIRIYQYDGATLQKPAMGPLNQCDDCSWLVQLGDPHTF